MDLVANSNITANIKALFQFSPEKQKETTVKSSL
jgi:hypothetical protein